MDFLKKHIEALIFCATQPLKPADIAQCLSEMFGTPVNDDDIANALTAIQAQYTSDESVFEVLYLGGGYQFMTKPAYQESIGILLKQQSKKRLSRSALETLAIVAYKQPMTKAQVEQIRGVNCDYAVKKLLDKELLELRGKAETVGRPLLYGTSPKFLEYFGINDLKDLPTPKDFAQEDNEIGESAQE